MRLIPSRLGQKFSSKFHPTRAHQLQAEGRGLLTAYEGLRALFAAITDMVFVIDRNGRYLDVPQTRAGAATYLRPGPQTDPVASVQELIVGKTLHELMPKEQADAFLGPVQESLRCGDTVTYEYPLRIDGREMWFSAAISPLSDDSVVIVARDVSDSKRTEQELQRWQERHLAMVNSVDAILWEAKADFSEFTFVSEQAERLLGYPTEQWLNDLRFWVDHIYVEDRDWAVSFCKAKTAANEDHAFEYRMVAADGRLVWIRDIVTVVAEEGRPVFLRGVMIDITELKESITETRRTEQELRRWQERHLAMVNSVDAILWEADGAASGFTFVSEQAVRLLGYPVERWLNEPAFWPDHIHPDDRRWVVDYCLTRIARREDHEFEYRMLAADGRTVWLKEIVNVMAGDGGDVTIRGFMIDITELKQAFTQLADQEQQYRNIFESTSDGLVINDLETGIILSANPAFCRMHGYDQMVGMLPTTHIHPDSHYLFQEYVDTVRQAGQFRARAQDIRSDGSVFDVEVTGRGFTYQGRPAILGVVRDVSEQVRSEQLLEQRVSDRTNELESLLNLARVIGSTLDSDALVRLILQDLREVLQFKAAVLVLLDQQQNLVVRDVILPEGQSMGSELHVRLQEWRRSAIDDESLLDKLGRGEPVVIQEHAEGQAFAIKPPSVGAPANFVRSWMAVPLILKDELLGYIAISSDEAGYFGLKHVRLARAFADHASIAIENARLYKQAGDRTREIERRRVVAEGLRDLLAVVNSGRSLDEILDAIVVQARSLLASDASSILLPLNENKDMLATRSASGFGEYRWTRLPTGRSAVGLALTLRRPAMVNDVFTAYEKGEGTAKPLYEEQDGLLRVVSLPQPEVPEDAAVQAAMATNYRGLLVVPLASREEVYGGLALAYREPREFTQDEVALASAFADQAALAMENARLYERILERTKEIERRRAVAEGLRELLAVVNSGQSLTDILEEVVVQARKLLQSDASAIMLPDKDEQVLAIRAASGHSEEHSQARLAIGLSATGLAYTLRRPAAVRDVPAVYDPRNADPADLGKPIFEDQGSHVRLKYLPAPEDEGEAARLKSFGATYRGFLAVPLISRETAYGALSLSYGETRDFNDDEVSLAMAFADQAALAIENARLYEQAAERTQELTALLSVSNSVASTLELEPLLRLIVAQIVTVVEPEYAAVHLLQDDALVLLSARTPDGSLPIHGQRLPMKEGPIWDSLRLGQTVFIKDLSDDSNFARRYHQIRDWPYELGSMIAVPLSVEEQVIGVLSVAHSQYNFFTDRHVDLLSAIANQVAVAVEKARLYEQAQQAAALEERQRLARELHDSVSQALYGIALGARTARALIDRDPGQAVEPMDYVLSLAEAGLAEMRALIFELRPESLEQEGLVAALEKRVAATSARHRIQIQADLGSEPQISLAEKEAIYRIGQEALHNIVKHAKATHVRIRLSDMYGSPFLEIEDDGLGFDPDQAFPGHMGLVSMTERARSIGCRLEITSAPGQGTHLRLLR